MFFALSPVVIDKLRNARESSAVLKAVVIAAVAAAAAAETNPKAVASPNNVLPNPSDLPAEPCMLDPKSSILPLMSSSPSFNSARPFVVNSM